MPSLPAWLRAALSRSPASPSPAPPAAVEVAAAAPAPEEPAWVRSEALARKPRLTVPAPSRQYQDLPVVSMTNGWDSVSAVRGALANFEQGNFSQASEIVEAMMADDRIKGVVTQRVDGLLGLPFSMALAAQDDQAAAEIASEAKRLWPKMADENILRDVWKWGRFLGIGVAEKLYDTEGPDGWVPRLKLWHPRYIYWRWDTRSFWINTQTGPVELKQGDPHWLLYTPYGYYRGWMEGLIRSLAIPWLFRQFGYRDWGRYNEVHGLPIRGILEPSEWSDEEKQKALREVAMLASESVIRLPQIAGKGGFDMKLIEAVSRNYDSFKLGMEQANSSIAVVVLGQNLTSEVKGGAYSAAQVHERVAASIIRSDAKTMGAALREQVLVEWAAVNHGKPDLAPTPTWDTAPPEDLKARSEALDKLGDALKKLGDANVPVDVERLAAEFGVPLRELTDEERKRIGLPPIYEYHLKYGIPTVNQVLVRLGLPPRPDGDVPANQAELDAAKAAAAARSRPGKGEAPEEEEADETLARIIGAALARAQADLPAGARAGQAYVDDLAASGTPAGAADLEPDLAVLLRIVRETPGREGKPDEREIKRRLLAAFQGMDPAQLARTVTKTQVLAQLQGRAAVLEDL